MLLLLKRLAAATAVLMFAMPAFADEFGSATGGTRATMSALAGCAYVSSPTVLTTGQQSGLLCSPNGELIVQSSTSAPSAVQGVVADGAAVSGNPVLIAGRDSAGNAQTVSTDTDGVQVITGSGSAGTAAAGVVTVQGAASMTPVRIGDSTGTARTVAVGAGDIALALASMYTQLPAVTNNGTNYKLISAATTNATSLKASGGGIGFGVISNLTASTKFMKFYNKGTPPTVGTDIPVWTLAIPANGNVDLASVVGPFGLWLSTGIAFAITGGYADSDTTAVAAGDVIVNLTYR